MKIRKKIYKEIDNVKFISELGEDLDSELGEDYLDSDSDDDMWISEDSSLWKKGDVVLLNRDIFQFGGRNNSMVQYLKESRLHYQQNLNKFMSLEQKGIIFPFDVAMNYYIAQKKYYEDFQEECRVIYYGNKENELLKSLSQLDNEVKVTLKRGFSNSSMNVQTTTVEMIRNKQNAPIPGFLWEDVFVEDTDDTPQIKTCVQLHYIEPAEYKLCYIVKNNIPYLVGHISPIPPNYSTLNQERQEHTKWNVIAEKCQNFAYKIACQIIIKKPKHRHVFYRIDVFYDFLSKDIILNEIDSYQCNMFCYFKDNNYGRKKFVKIYKDIIEAAKSSKAEDEQMEQKEQTEQTEQTKQNKTNKLRF